MCAICLANPCCDRFFQIQPLARSTMAQNLYLLSRNHCTVAALRLGDDSQTSLLATAPPSILEGTPSRIVSRRGTLQQQCRCGRVTHRCFRRADVFYVMSPANPIQICDTCSHNLGSSMLGNKPAIKSYIRLYKAIIFIALR